MQIVSLNVGLPRSVEWRGKPVETGIFKQAVSGARAVTQLNVAARLAKTGQHL